MDINVEIEIYVLKKRLAKSLQKNPIETLPTVIFMGIYKNTTIIKWLALAKPSITRS